MKSDQILCNKAYIICLFIMGMHSMGQALSPTEWNGLYSKTKKLIMQNNKVKALITQEEFDQAQSNLFKLEQQMPAVPSRQKALYARKLNSLQSNLNLASKKVIAGAITRQPMINKPAPVRENPYVIVPTLQPSEEELPYQVQKPVEPQVPMPIQEAVEQPTQKPAQTVETVEEQPLQEKEETKIHEPVVSKREGILKRKKIEHLSGEICTAAQGVEDSLQDEDYEETEDLVQAVQKEIEDLRSNVQSIRQEFPQEDISDAENKAQACQVRIQDGMSKIPAKTVTKTIEKPKVGSGVIDPGALPTVKTEQGVMIPGPTKEYGIQRPSKIETSSISTPRPEAPSKPAPKRPTELPEKSVPSIQPKIQQLTGSEVVRQIESLTKKLNLLNKDTMNLETISESEYVKALATLNACRDGFKDITALDLDKAKFVARDRDIVEGMMVAAWTTLRVVDTQDFDLTMFYVEANLTDDNFKSMQDVLQQLYARLGEKSDERLTLKASHFEQAKNASELREKLSSVSD